MKKKPPRRPRIEEVAPAIRDAALVTYSQTGSIQAVARACGLSWFGARAVLTRDPKGFQEAKEAAGRAALETSALYALHAVKKAHKLTPMQAVIASKIASQQAVELTSQPAPPVQVNVNVLAAAADLLDRLRSRGTSSGSEPTASPDPQQTASK